MKWTNSMRIASAVFALFSVLTVWSCNKDATPAVAAPATQPSTPVEPPPGSHPMGAGMQHPGTGSMGMGMEGHGMLLDGGFGHR